MYYHYSRKIHYPATKPNGVLCNARSKVRKLDTTEYPDEVTCGNCIASLEAMKSRNPGPMLPFMPAPKTDYMNVSGKVYVAQLSPVNVVFERKGFGPGSSKVLYDNLRRKADRFGRLKVVMVKQHLEELDSGLRVPALFLDSGLSPESSVKRKPVMDIPLAVTKRDATGVHIFPGILRDSWKDTLNEMPNLKLDLYCLLRQRMEAEFELLKEQSDKGRLRVRVSKVDDKSYIYLDNTRWVIEEAFLKNASEIVSLAENAWATASESVKDNPELVEFIARAVQTEVASQLSQAKSKHETPVVEPKTPPQPEENTPKWLDQFVDKLPEGKFTPKEVYSLFPNYAIGYLRGRLCRAVSLGYLKKERKGVYTKKGAAYQVDQRKVNKWRENSLPEISFKEAVVQLPDGEFTSQEAYSLFPSMSHGTVSSRLCRAIEAGYIRRTAFGHYEKIKNPDISLIRSRDSDHHSACGGKSPHTLDASTRSKEGRKRKKRAPNVPFSEVLKRLPKGEFNLDDACAVFPNTPRGTVTMRLHKAVREEYIKRKEPGVYLNEKKAPESEDEDRFSGILHNCRTCSESREKEPSHTSDIGYLRIDLVESWDEALTNLSRIVGIEQSAINASLPELRKKWLLLQSTHRLGTVPVRLQEGENPLHKDLIYWDSDNTIPWFMVDMKSPVTRKAVRKAREVTETAVA